MTISVVMPAKNASTTIADSIRSILSIPLVSELIVVDDRSTDETEKIVRGFDDERIRIILGPGAGISAAINCGIKASSCEYIARCDADDLYPQDRFEWQIDWLNDNDGYVAISGGFSTIDSEGRAVADLACDGVAGDVTMRLLEGDAVTSFCSWLTRKTALDEVGGAREWFVTAEDLVLMFRLASRGRVWHEPLSSSTPQRTADVNLHRSGGQCDILSRYCRPLYGPFHTKGRLVVGG